jgi:hypothetical protein
VQKGRSAILVEAPVSIGDLLRKTVPQVSSSSSSQEISTTPRNARNGRVVESSAGMGVRQTNERATLRELLSMQQETTTAVVREREGRERFPPNPFS